jgi:hypothetical protein
MLLVGYISIREMWVDGQASDGGDRDGGADVIRLLGQKATTYNFLLRMVASVSWPTPSTPFAAHSTYLWTQVSAYPHVALVAHSFYYSIRSPLSLMEQRSTHVSA